MSAALSLDVCDRCNRIGETLPEGWCPACWEPDEVQDVLIEIAGAMAVGELTDEQADDRIRESLGRDMSEGERREWLDNVATGLEHTEYAGELAARRRGDLVLAVAALVKRHGVEDVSWALGVVEGDLAESAAVAAAVAEAVSS